MMDQPTQPATAPVETLTPDPEVWAVALEYADGDPRLLEVRGRAVVVVHNQRVR